MFSHENQNPESGNILQVGYKTNLIPKNPVRAGKESKIFERAYRYLTEEGRDPGHIALVVLEDSGDYRMVGAFSHNKNGSISFFPDFNERLTVTHFTKEERIKSAVLPQFDHFTLNKDFLKRGHITDPKTGKHFLKHDPIKLSEGVYAWLTITVTDNTELNDFSGELNTAFSVTHKSSEDYISLITDRFGGIIVKKFPEIPKPGLFGCLQFLLIEKGMELPESFFNGPFDTALFESTKIPENVMANSFFHPTKNDFGYDLLVRAFNLEGRPKDSILITTPTLNISNPGY